MTDNTEEIVSDATADLESESPQPGSAEGLPLASDEQPAVEDFAALFELSLRTIEMDPGAIVTGTIVDIDKDFVIVHAGLKSEGVIPAASS